MRHALLSLLVAAVMTAAPLFAPPAFGDDCAATIEGITVLTASGEAIVVDIPDRGHITVTRADVDQAARVLQLIYRIDPEHADRIVDKLAAHTKLGIFGEAALAAMTKTALAGDAQATDTVITLVMQQSPATLQRLLDRAIALGRSNPMLCTAIAALSPRR